MLLGAVGPLYGQDVAIGLKAGANVSDVITDASEFDNIGRRGGFIGGLFVDAALTALGSIQLEGLYSQKGLLGRSGTSNLRLTYIDVPLLLKGSYNARGSGFRPAAYVGGVVSFETSCRVSDTSGGESPDTDCDEDTIELETNKTDFGLLVGLSTDILLSDSGFYLVLDARHTWGLVDIVKEPSLSDSVRNRYWSFMAGFGVPLGN